ncbi:MAG TPA: PHP domain-containing protein [Clostridiaceae bacterium]|nr:PHP domain-containing protein [Clostridiaceae bacterium]
MNEEEYSNLVENLNNEDVNIRLRSLEQLKSLIDKGIIKEPERYNDVNNHIHTTFSFSPYSPTKSVWMAYMSGLITAGIVDHDSIAGAEEFIEAGRIMNLPTTIGVECRVDFSCTPLKGRRINNPDQSSIAYVTLHGIPHTKINDVKQYFIPYIEERNKRNRLMVERINNVFAPFGIKQDFDNDIVPLSQFRNGGTITERHILYSLALKLVEKYGKGQSLVNFLKEQLNINLKTKLENYLLDKANPFYEYDLLGVLKSDLVSIVYVDAKEECPDVREFLEFGRKIGAISAYAYLGDVTDSVTGDKRRQKFEDDYIDELFQVLKDLGFNAVTYMPSRNTREQLRKVKSLCQEYGFFQISGEDINSPRQPFVCKAMRDPEFANLVDSTWALIGHEIAATRNIDEGMFSQKTIEKYPDLNERTAVYKEIGQRGY